MLNVSNVLSALQPKVLFQTTVRMKDSKGNHVVREVLASDLCDSFIDNASELNITLGESNDAMIDVYKRFDKLEAALKELVCKTENIPDALSKAKAIRNDMLPPEIETNRPSGDSLSDVLEHFDFSQHNQGYATGVSTPDSVDNLNVSVSIDTSYSKDDRNGLRVFSTGIDSIFSQDNGSLIVIKMMDTIDNYDMMERINTIEKTIDKLEFTLTNDGKFHAGTLKYAMSVLDKNTVQAY